MRGYLPATLFLMLLSCTTPALFAAPLPKPGPAPPPPLDFSGVWALDAKVSRNVSLQMRDAVLSVTQSGDRIWISAVQTPGAHRQAILSEEIVADGRPYEKTLGPAGMGIVTAGWAKDGKSLWIQVLAGAAEDPGSALQRSVWKLSADKTVWTRDSVSVSRGQAKTARLVFRKRKS